MGVAQRQGPCMENEWEPIATTTAPVWNGGDGSDVGWPSKVQKMQKPTGSMCAWGRSDRAAEEGVDVSSVNCCRRWASCVVAWWSGVGACSGRLESWWFEGETRRGCWKKKLYFLIRFSLGGNWVETFLLHAPPLSILYPSFVCCFHFIYTPPACYSHSLCFAFSFWALLLANTTVLHWLLPAPPCLLTPLPLHFYCHFWACFIFYLLHSHLY